MALQKVFTPGYIQHLKSNIKIENYLGEAFPYDSKYTRQLAGVPHPEDLLSKLVPTPDGDLQSAIAIYEAYPNISPVLAQKDDLWVYLSHVDLFEYVQKRWAIKGNAEEADKITHIINHWHRNPKHLFRTSICGLWWQVYLTRDDSRQNPYELTEIYFQAGQDFHQRFGELLTIRHREAMIGILEFLLEHKELTNKNFDPKGQYISQLFNLIGGTKALASLNRQFFKNELEKRLTKIASIQNRNEVQNQTIE